MKDEVNSDAQKAADLYLVSREQIGVSESTDIMEEIADCFTDRAQKKEWYARAEAHDSARACFTLAQLYYDDYEYIFRFLRYLKKPLYYIKKITYVNNRKNNYIFAS